MGVESTEYREGWSSGMIDQMANIEGSMQLGNIGNAMIATLIKNKIKFFLFIRKF